MAETVITPKQAYIETLELLPEGLEEFLTKQLPESPACDLPTDVEGAVIAQGKLSKYLLDLFREFQGLRPLHIFMRIGQHNPITQSMLFAGLEYIGGSTGLIDIIAPKAGGVYYGFFSDWRVRVIRGEPDKITIACNDDEEEMIESEGLWTAAFPIPIGEHTATVKSDLFQETVSFSVKHYQEIPTFPEDGVEYEAEEVEEIRIETGDSTPYFSNVQCDLDGEVSTMEMIENYFRGGLLNALHPGRHTYRCSWKDSGETIIKGETINFIIN